MPVEKSKSKKDDSAFTIGSDGVMPMGALVDETSPDSADEGDVGIPRMTASRILRVALSADGGGSIAKAEDAAHVTGDLGIMLLAVRQNTAAALAGTDGDYIPVIVDGSGRLHIGPAPANSGVDIGNVDVLSIAAGDNNIGNVDLASAIPAGTNNIGKVQISDGSNAIASAATSNDNENIAGNYTVPAKATLMLRDPGSTNFSRWVAISGSGAGIGVAQVGTMGELITLAASAARTESANGTAVTGLGWRNRYIVLFDLTVADTDAGDTLDVYIDVSLDGSTWLNAVHFTQIIGTDAASKRYAVLDPSAPGTAEILVTADAAAGVVRPSLFGPQMRARWAIVDAGTDDASFTFSVTGYAI